MILPPDFKPMVATMTDEQLQTELCTCEMGRWRAFKEAALNELIDRAIATTLRQVRGEP